MHAFAPLVVIIGVFETVGFVVGAANSARWDTVLAAVDARLFGALVPAWRGALGRPAWLSDVLSAFYVSYYPVPAAMGVALFVRGRREDFDRFVFALQLTLIVSYLGYFFFPTSGPRVPPEAAQAMLGGGAVSATGVRARHTFREVGEQLVVLAVADEYGGVGHAAARIAVLDSPIFSDDFESGDTTAWSSTAP